MSKSATTKNEVLVGIKIEKAKTDNGQNALLVHYRGACRAYTFKKYMADRNAFYTELSEWTDTLIIGEIRSNIEVLCRAAPLNKKVIVATKPGFGPFEKGKMPTYYAYPDGVVLAAKKSVKANVVTAFPLNPNASEKGDIDTYLNGIGKIITTQPMPLFFFLFGLSPIIKPFAEIVGYFVENVIVEAVGPSGRNKSTITNFLAGSLWGGSKSKIGFARSWNATTNAIEEVFPQYNDGLLILDEATAVSGNKHTRAEEVLKVTHQFSLGVPKSRMGDDRGHDTYSILAMSNSNQTLGSILNETSDVMQAADVRILSFVCPERPSGFFEPEIEGFASAAQAGAAIRELCKNNYGLLAPYFIEEILALCNSDPELMLKMIKSDMQNFLKKADVDDNDTALRKAKPFALAYATARLAQHLGFLLEETWGKTFCSKLINAYDTYRLQNQQHNPIEKLKALYVSKAEEWIRVEKPEDRKEMSDEVFGEVDGFVFSAKGRYCLGMTSRSLQRYFGDTTALVSKLDIAGMLVANDGRQFKKQLRNQNGKPVADRIYAIDTAFLS